MFRFFALGVAVGIAFGFPITAAAQRPAKLATTIGSMRVQVVDEALRPLDKAKLHVSVWTDDKHFKANRDYTCDAAGVVDIELPETVQIVRIWASHAGHAELFANFSAEPQASEFTIPTSFTFRLPQGTVMGGIVQDEGGQPIAGATIELRYTSGGAQRDDNTLPSIGGGATTDVRGRWRLDTIPPGEDVEVRIKLSHPDFISDQHEGELQRKQNVTRQALRDQSATIVMQRGFVVTGTVSDNAGKPVAGAVAIWGDRPYWQTGSQEVRTGEDGRFRFVPLPAGPMRLTVVAEGFAPDSKKIEIGLQLPPADFQLQPGKKLQLKFVDSAGKAVPDVGVSIDKWRGAEALYNHKHPNVIDVRVPTRADKNGLFEWSWAPADAVSYSFYKTGFARTTASISAANGEHIQTLNRVLTIGGSVRDAVTGEPIDDFLAIPVIHFRPDFPFLPRELAERQKAGRFSLEFERTDIEHGVQIEAPGYVTYRTPERYKIGDTGPTLDVRLLPAAQYAGRVVAPDGRPVSGAEVYVGTNFQSVEVHDLRDRRGYEASNYRVKTDARGRFEIVPQMEPYALVVIAEEGYAEVQRQGSERPGEVRIQPWAKVRGRLVQNGQPVPNCEVLLEPLRSRGNDEPRINSFMQATTAADGGFSFERAPPIACRVRGFLHFSVDSTLSSSRSVPLSLAPGEEAVVKLGSEGIEITGQLAVQNQRPDFDYHFSISYLVAKRPGIDAPGVLASETFDWRKGWSDAWRNSAEGESFIKTLHTWFVKPTPDGRIRVSGVEPGDYELVINLFGSTEGCLVHPIATRVLPLTIKPGDADLELGTVVIPSLTLPQIGDPAPAFKFTTLDGTSASLAGLRGKYVLLDFWATWCGPCIAKIDEVESLRRELAESRIGLVVIGVNLDADTARAKAFLKTKPLPWQHALLGDWSSTDVPRRFAIASVPSYILLDPAGRIMAHECSLGPIAAKLKGLSVSLK